MQRSSPKSGGKERGNLEDDRGQMQQEDDRGQMQQEDDRGQMQQIMQVTENKRDVKHVGGAGNAWHVTRP
jgi:hypothetical protein